MSNEGKILNPSTIVFTKEAIEEKKNFSLQNKLKKNIVKSNKRQFENILLNETSIVPNHPATSEKKKKICQSKGSTVVSNSHVQTWETSASLLHQPLKFNDYQPSTSGYNCQPSSLQQQDIPTLQANFQPENVEPQITSMQESYPNSDEIGNTQIHPPVNPAIPPPPCGKFSLLNNEDEISVSSSSEDEDIINENWSGAINAMAATFPGKSNLLYFYSIFTAFKCITSLYL